MLYVELLDGRIEAILPKHADAWKHQIVRIVRDTRKISR